MSVLPPSSQQTDKTRWDDGLLTFVTKRKPPASRAAKCDGRYEHQLSEMGVILAVAEWLFIDGAETVCIYPDGMHPKGFNTTQWLKESGFTKREARGNDATALAGRYQRGHQTLEIFFRSGRGDVTATVRGTPVLVETKGGCINTSHSGQVSKLRRGLHEAVGMLVGRGASAGRRIAAIPRHKTIEKVAKEIAPHCIATGVEIMLVSGDGNIHICDLGPAHTIPEHQPCREPPIL